MRVAVFDLDGTISRRDLFLVFLMEAAKQLGTARPIETAMLPLHTLRYGLRKMTNTALKAAYLQAVLGGRRRDALQSIAFEFAESCLLREVKPAALAALERHRQAGDTLLLASASFDLYVDPIGQRLGFDATLSTKVAWTPDDAVAGSLDGSNLRGAPKLAAVSDWLARNLPDTRELVAYSDHESDLPLLMAATTAVAVDPTRKLRQEARERGWPVVDWSRDKGKSCGVPADRFIRLRRQV